MEQTVAGLESKRAVAETALHKAQIDVKEAHDQVHSAKKHAVVLQETLTVSRRLLLSRYC